MDRRVQRTRKLLHDALLGLILEQGYESITVQEIVDRANLGRSTFYIHFKDKEDLLLKAMEEGYRSLENHMKTAELKPGSFAPLELVFDYAAENRELFLVVLHGAGKMAFYRQAHDYLSERMLEIARNLFQQPRIPLHFTALYFASALLGMLIWWLEADMPYSSVEMVSMMRVLFREGAYGIQDSSPSDGLVS
ncbi:MAG: TetR/AcrR family transcriptional regulator [Anaerolineales bacterium]|nr:TetR/AcrR family transcriptional regulator [Anaerolineales bacterium]